MALVWEYVKKPEEYTPVLAARHIQAEKLLGILKASPEPIEFHDLIAKSGYARNTVKTTLYLLKNEVGAVRSVVFKGNKKIDTDGLLRFPSVKKWTDELKPGSSRKNSLYTFARFLKYLRSHSEFKDPEALLTNALDASRRDLSNHVDLLKAFVSSITDTDLSTKQKKYATIRSWYSHNGCELPSSPLKILESGPPEIEKNEDDSIKMYELAKKAVNQAKCSVRDRAIVLCILQSGMDDSTLTQVFNFLAYSQLCDHFKTQNWQDWDPSKSPVRINLIRPKTGRKYYSFLDCDAIQCLKDWLAVRFSQTSSEIKILDGSRKDTIARSEPIFINADGSAMKSYYPGYIFRKLGKEAGINIAPEERPERFRGATIRYAFHAHEVRDTLRSLASIFNADVAGEFFLGHEIDKMKYNKSPRQHPEHFRELYSKMAPYLNILSTDPEKAKLIEQVERSTKEKEAIEGQYFVKSKMLEDEIKALKESRENDSAVLAELQAWLKKHKEN